MAGKTALKSAWTDRGQLDNLDASHRRNLKRKKDWSDLKVAINYVKATAEMAETKHNAQLEIQHDWLLEDSRWSPFCKMIAVYDEFRSFRFETTLNAGMGYRFIDNDVTTFKARFGSGATRKFRDANNTWEPEACLASTSSTRSLTARSSVRPWNTIRNGGFHDVSHPCRRGMGGVAG